MRDPDLEPEGDGADDLGASEADFLAHEWDEHGGDPSDIDDLEIADGAASDDDGAAEGDDAEPGDRIRPADPLLAQWVAERRFVKVDRDVEGDASSCGYLLAASDDWLLIHQAVDFHLDGYAAISLRDVTALRHGRYERAFEEIMRAEGVAPQVGLGPESPYSALPVESSSALFRGLMDAGRSIIIEGERSGDEIFLIGPLKRVGELSFSIRPFDATGRFDPLPTLLRYDRVTRVTFDSEYVNVFSRYARE